MEEMADYLFLQCKKIGEAIVYSVYGSSSLDKKKCIKEAQPHFTLFAI